jgi:hypothetical protein
VKTYVDRVVRGKEQREKRRAVLSKKKNIKNSQKEKYTMVRRKE